MKTLLFILFIFPLVSYLYANDSTKKETIITGKFSWEEWKQKALWDEYEPKDYFISSDSLSLLKNKIKEKNLSFIIFSGSWCKDTKSELPKIIKIFNQIQLNDDSYLIYGLDRQKQEPSGFFIQYNITNVPTLIILANGIEIGRIIEFPKKSWISDLVEIVN